MSEARTNADSVPWSHRARLGSVENGLHLVLGLDLVQASLRCGDDGIARLENVRQCLPNVIVTFYTDLQASDTVNLLSEGGVRLPDHLLAEAGGSIHHQNGFGGMDADPEYREWLDIQRNDSGANPDSAKAIGLEYLEVCWDVPRPLMVVGNPCTDASILGLADIPVALGTEDAGPGNLAFSTCRVFHLEIPGLSEVVKFLLADSSGGSSQGCMKAGRQAEHQALERPKEISNAWSRQPRMAGRTTTEEIESRQGRR